MGKGVNDLASKASRVATLLRTRGIRVMRADPSLELRGVRTSIQGDAVIVRERAGSNREERAQARRVIERCGSMLDGEYACVVCEDEGGPFLRVGPARDTFEELSERRFSPTFAPARREAVAGVLGDDRWDPVEFAESLDTRAVVPQGWFESPSRRFGHVSLPPEADSSRPPSVLAAAALAADWEGVESAESLAREVASRLKPWRVEAVRTFRWLQQPLESHGAGGSIPPLPLEETLRVDLLARGRVGLAVREFDAAEDSVVRRLRDIVDAYGAWKEAHGEAWKMRAPPPGRLSDGESLEPCWAQSPDIFAPLCAIVRRGYFLVDVSRGVATFRFVAPPASFWGGPSDP